MELIDFDKGKRIGIRGYRGNAGRKQAYLYNDELWMVKFPQSTRDLAGKHLPSYTSSPLSEYIGSQVYGALGIPVHDTIIGHCQGKIVVGCKDFAVNSELMEFSQIKNTIDEELISGSYGSSAQGERLSDVLKVIECAEAFSGLRDKVRERFWDMFVTDAFILNNDRNNGNWGLLLGRYTIELAPVFDNGNALFNKRTVSVEERRGKDTSLVKQDVFTGVSFFLDDNGHHLYPFRFMESMENNRCNDAILRFAGKLDMDRMFGIIDAIPEHAWGLNVISKAEKDFYKQLLETAWREGIAPISEKLVQGVKLIQSL
ncbi:CtkA family protein [Lachnospiraceae bacterium JLR.KK009]|jgi:hypothetical protein|nr:hypothetical protein C810_04684 [Lachnospiraceae bacterium A2]MCI8882823.1 CtkA family protein [Lachnospiraceae bacterium]